MKSLLQSSQDLSSTKNGCPVVIMCDRKSQLKKLA